MSFSSCRSCITCLLHPSRRRRTRRFKVRNSVRTPTSVEAHNGEPTRCRRDDNRTSGGKPHDDASRYLSGATPTDDELNHHRSVRDRHSRKPLVLRRSRHPSDCPTDFGQPVLGLVRLPVAFDNSFGGHLDMAPDTGRPDIHRRWSEPTEPVLVRLHVLERRLCHASPFCVFDRRIEESVRASVPATHALVLRPLDEHVLGDVDPELDLDNQHPEYDELFPSVPQSPRTSDVDTHSGLEYDA